MVFQTRKKVQILNVRYGRKRGLVFVYRSELVIEAKSDASPVTEADRKAEVAMRKLIQESFPEHGIFGEEEGMHVGSTSGEQSSPSYLWVLDPIDGTKSFITGLPLVSGDAQ